MGRIRREPGTSGPALKVALISPHFDDVPLSLGQSLRDGLLSRCEVRTRVAFGRTNWTTWIHPKPERAAYVSLWRRIEETAAAQLFGYRWTAASWEELILRQNSGLRKKVLDSDLDLTNEPLVGEIADWLVLVANASQSPDVILVPGGLGGHIDHRIVAAAALQASRSIEAPIGFFEDRPYASYASDEEIAEHMAGLGADLRALEVSGPVSRTTQLLARACYPSQMTAYFADAMDKDRAALRGERVWLPQRESLIWLEAAGCTRQVARPE